MKLAPLQSLLGDIVSTPPKVGIPVCLWTILNADDWDTANLAGITVLGTAPVIEDNLVMWLMS